MRPAKGIRRIIYLSSYIEVAYSTKELMFQRFKTKSLTYQLQQCFQLSRRLHLQSTASNGLDHLFLRTILPSMLETAQLLVTAFDISTEHKLANCNHAGSENQKSQVVWRSLGRSKKSVLTIQRKEAKQRMKHVSYWFVFEFDYLAHNSR